MKGHITAATYQIRLRILTACRIFSILYYRLGNVHPLEDQGPHVIHGSWGLPRVHTTNSSSIGSATFAGFKVVTNRHTNLATSIAIGHI